MKEQVTFKLIVPPPYVGHLELVPGHRIMLTKMPSPEHQKNMTEAFGFTFVEY